MYGRGYLQQLHVLFLLKTGDCRQATVSPGTCYRHTSVLRSQQNWVSWLLTGKRGSFVFCGHVRTRMLLSGRREGMAACLSAICHLSSQLCSSCRSMAKPSALKGALNTRRFFFRTPWKKVFAGPGLCSGGLPWLGCNEPADTGVFCLLIFLIQFPRTLCSWCSPPASHLE